MTVIVPSYLSLITQISLMHLQCSNNNLKVCCTLYPRVSGSWCRLLHQKKVKALNVVIVEGLTQSHFYKHFLSLPHLTSTYTTVGSACWWKVIYSYRLCFEIIISGFLLFAGIRGSPWLPPLQTSHRPSSAAKSPHQSPCSASKHMGTTVRCTKVSVCIFVCNIELKCYLQTVSGMQALLCVCVCFSLLQRWGFTLSSLRLGARGKDYQRMFSPRRRWSRSIFLLKVSL